MSTATAERVGFFTRTKRFLREVIIELRKVTWPTKQQVVTYTGVVIVFVTIMAVLVQALDLGFTRLVILIFG